MRKSVWVGSVAALALGMAIGAADAQTAAAPDALNAAPTNTPPAAAATEPGASDGEIIVTGSRIRRDPLSLPAPVTFLDQTAI